MQPSPPAGYSYEEWEGAKRAQKWLDKKWRARNPGKRAKPKGEPFRHLLDETGASPALRKIRTDRKFEQAANRKRRSKKNEFETLQEILSGKKKKARDKAKLSKRRRDTAQRIREDEEKERRRRERYKKVTLDGTGDDR